MATIRKETDVKFMNADTAIMALQMMQAVFTLKGNLTSNYLYPQSNVYELSVHFENGQDFPKVPNGYLYSTKEITSHEYYSERTKESERVRVVRFTFKTM